MAQVGLRIAIWVLVLGIAYFAFGPKLFDSSGDGNPFTSDKALYLPPEKPQALRDFERLAGQRDLSDSEQADYLAAMQAYQGIFWRAEGTTIDARGTDSVVNQFGGNCFGCHAKAAPQWDFICGADHGCDPLGLSPQIIEGVQQGDARCTQ